MPKFKRHFTAEEIENQVCENTDEIEKLNKKIDSILEKLKNETDKDRKFWTGEGE